MLKAAFRNAIHILSRRRAPLSAPLLTNLWKTMWIKHVISTQNITTAARKGISTGL